MPINSESLNRKLYDLLTVRGYNPKPLDVEGKVTPVPEESAVMKFDFVKDDKNYGQVWISIDGSKTLQVYYGDAVADSPSDKTRDASYDDTWTGLIRHLKNWAQRRQLGFELKNENHLESDMAKRSHTAKKEKISEASTAGKSNSSFIITAKTAEGDTKKYRVKAQSPNMAKEKFSQHHSMAKILNVSEEGMAEGSDKLKGTPVVSLSDFDDKDNTKNKYGQTVPKKLKKDDPRVKFHKEPKKQGVAEMDNRTPSGDRKEQRANSPEAIAQREKEQQAELKKVSPEMRKKLRLPNPDKEDMAEDIASTRREVNLKKKIDKGVATPEQKREYQELKAKNMGPHFLKSMGRPVPKQDVAEDQSGVSVKKWAEQVRQEHGADTKFWNDKVHDRVIARKDKEIVGSYDRKANNGTVFSPEQNVAEGSAKKDMTGQTCEKCKKDKYKERSWNDDRNGTLQCSCGHVVDRWKKYKEQDKKQGVAEGSEEKDPVWNKGTPMPKDYTCHCGIAVHPSVRNPKAIHTPDCPYAKKQDMVEGTDDSTQVLSDIVANEDFDALYDLMSSDTEAGKIVQRMYNDVSGEEGLHPDDDFEKILSIVLDHLTQDYGQQNMAEANGGHAGSAKVRYTGGMHGEYDPTKKQASPQAHLDAAKYHDDEANTYIAAMNHPKSDQKNKEWYKNKIQHHKNKADFHRQASGQQDMAEGYSLKKTSVSKHMEPGDPEEYTQDVNIKDTDYEIINNKTGQVVGTASQTTNDFMGSGALKITMKNGATRWLDIWDSEKGNPQTAFNRFVKDPKTASKYKGQDMKGVTEMDKTQTSPGRDGDIDWTKKQIHLGPEHTMKAKDVAKHALKVLNKTMKKSHVDILKKKGVAEAKGDEYYDLTAEHVPAKAIPLIKKELAQAGITLKWVKPRKYFEYETIFEIVTNEKGLKVAKNIIWKYNKGNYVGIMNEQDMAEGQESMKQVSEGYYPMGKQGSYSDAVPTTKIIIQHSRKIEEGEQRYRNIAKIFVENTQGERFAVPTIKPGIARVYARHIAEGGTPYDERGKHITSLVEEYSKMAGFVRATKGKQFNESAQQLVNEGLTHYQSLRESLRKMTGHRGYNAYFESWTPSLMEDGEEQTNLNELFVQETLDPRIESVMPILSRLHKKVSEMAETGQLAEWADSLLDETLNVQEENVPLRDKEDLQARRKAIQDIISDPDTAKDPLLKREVMKRKHDLEKEAEAKRLAEEMVDESANVPMDVRTLYAQTYAKFAKTAGAAKGAKQMAYAMVEKKYGKEIADKLKAYHNSNLDEELGEDLDSNQKRVGQLGPTEKVGPKGAVGKLVGANESVEQGVAEGLNEINSNGQEDLDAILRIIKK